MLYIFLLFMGVELSAQHNYQEVDSISYSLYSKSNWKSLIHFQEEIQNQKFDFYLLNLRFGFAHFYEKNYNSSILSFQKALHNDATSQVALEYLFWNYHYLADYQKADFYFVKLDPIIQDKIAYRPLQKLDFIYAESGLNFIKSKGKQQNLEKKGSNNASAPPKSLPYFNIGVQGNFSHQFGVYAAYYFQNENMELTDYKLHRGFIKPTYKWGSTFEAGVGLSYIYSNNNIAYQKSFSYSNTEEDVMVDGYAYQRVTNGEGVEKDTGIAVEKGYNATFYTTKLFPNFKVSPFAGFSKSTVNLNAVYTKEGTENVVYNYEGEEVYNEDFLIEDKEERNETSTYFRYSFGVNLGVDITNRLGLGVEVSSDLSNFNYISNLVYKASDRFEFALEYLAKEEAPLYYYNGLQFINNNKKAQRLGLLTKVNLTKSIDLYLVYQHDKIVIETDNISQSNTGILGVKYQF